MGLRSSDWKNILGAILCTLAACSGNPVYNTATAGAKKEITPISGNINFLPGEHPRFIAYPANTYKSQNSYNSVYPPIPYFGPTAVTGYGDGFHSKFDGVGYGQPYIEYGFGDVTGGGYVDPLAVVPPIGLVDPLLAGGYGVPFGGYGLPYGGYGGYGGGLYGDYGGGLYGGYGGYGGGLYGGYGDGLYGGYGGYSGHGVSYPAGGSYGSSAHRRRRR